jgi:hypothetical protein
VSPLTCVLRDFARLFYTTHTADTHCPTPPVSPYSTYSQYTLLSRIQPIHMPIHHTAHLAAHLRERVLPAVHRTLVSAHTAQLPYCSLHRHPCLRHLLCRCYRLSKSLSLALSSSLTQRLYRRQPSSSGRPPPVSLRAQQGIVLPPIRQSSHGAMRAQT